MCHSSPREVYTITLVNGTLTISPAQLTGVADYKTRTYGSPNPALTAVYTGFVNGDTAATALTGGLATTATPSSPPGYYPITRGTLAAANYTITFYSATLTVNPAPLTISADPNTKVYGQPNPALTATFTGLVNGDTPATIPGLALSTPATASSPVGSYAIYVYGAYSANYTITFVNGSLSVTRAPLTITADNKTRPSGQPNPTLTASYAGFVNGDTSSVVSGLTLTTTATVSSPPGTYPITPSGASAANYAITYVPGTLTVTGSPSTTRLTTSGSPSTYGQSVTFTATVTASGPVAGATVTFTDGAAALGTGTTNGSGVATLATGGLNAGTHTVTATYAGGGSLSGSSGCVSQVVNRAPLTISADNKSKVYGSANPALTASYSGFVNGDTASVVSGLTLSTTATAGSGVGSYPITPSGASAANYSVSFVNGTLTVTRAALTISADSKTKVYGSVNPTLTASYSGFVNGDTSAVVTGPSLTTTATVSSGVDSYPITATGASAANYTISYSAGTLSVTRAPLTITADNKTRVYGQPNPALTANYAGFVNGDTAAVVNGLTLTTTATTGSGVGSYPITASGASAVNYAISYAAGTLSVTRAPLTVTADSNTKVYGNPNPTLTASYVGLVNGDTPATALTGALTTMATAGSPVGSYPITQGTLVAANYSITFGPAILTVTPAPLTISADNQSKVYGSANPALTASYSGFVNGDTSTVVSGLSLSTTATTGSGVGSYPITASGASAANYTISYAAGTLTVTPAPLTISADNVSRVYGQANPTLTASYRGFVNGDTSAVVSGLILSTTATPASGVGSYPITGSGASAANYTISYVAGTLTVTPAPLTITADDQSKVAGNPVPTLTASYAGFVNGDTPAVVSGLSLSTYSGDTAGSYPIVPSGASAANYTITLVNGTLTVTPAPAVSLLLSAPTTVTAGQGFNVTVSAAAPYGNVDPTYLGTVSLTSTDPLAATLGSYTFTSGDAGTYTFTGLQLYTAGPQSLTASDGTLSAQANLTVNPDVAASLVLSGPSSATAGTPFQVTVTAYDAWGNIASGYLGTITFSCTDAAATLPADYPFQPGDQGTQSFQVTLQTSGTQRLTVTDTSNPSLTAFLDVTL